MNTKKFRIVSSAVVVLLLVVGLVPQVIAQETPEATTTAPVICDSTLILLLGLAQRDYGYQASVDLTQFERGQYAWLFDGMMGADQGGSMMATEEATQITTDQQLATQEATETLIEPADATAEATTEAGTSFVQLIAPTVLDENAACTELRADLERFFSDQTTVVGAG